jgi:hypothetical protein
MSEAATGVIRGLSKIKEVEEAKRKEQEEREARKERGEEGKVRWFGLKDGKSARVVFLQELDEDSPNYSKKNDLGVQAVEHSNPDRALWMRKALCTIGEGACWACEQHQKDFKAKWGQRTKLYINVLVDDGENEPYVAVLSQGVGGRSITPTLIDEATDEGTITNRWYTIKRNGAKLDDTAYTLRADKKEHDLNVEDYDVYDIQERVLFKVPYEKQEAHYFDGGKAPQAAVEEEKTSEPVSATSVDSEW